MNKYECAGCGEVLYEDELDPETDLCPDCLDEYDLGGWDGSPRFADPGGNSALRATTPDNPRNLPCPSCGTPDVLTPADVAQKYQCNACADRVERGF